MKYKVSYIWEDGKVHFRTVKAENEFEACWKVAHKFGLEAEHIYSVKEV